MTVVARAPPPTPETPARLPGDQNHKQIVEACDTHRLGWPPRVGDQQKERHQQEQRGCAGKTVHSGPRMALPTGGYM
jgi:hypothetical protein